MRKFGLVGKGISYSFSRAYFTDKFSSLGIEASYENFDLADISDFDKILRENSGLAGLNVTIPYKEEVIAYLDQLDPTAAEIGAVNTIRILKNGKLKGFNTDHFGFTESLKPYLNPGHEKALILGTGGASKAIAYGLKVLGIKYTFVSRKASPQVLSYEKCSEKIMRSHQIIVNCTPLGTSPKTEAFPAVPMQHINREHLIYDLIYNPEETRLMQLGSQRGATTVNGRKMLEIQAEEAWKIWNS